MISIKILESSLIAVTIVSSVRPVDEEKGATYRLDEAKYFAGFGTGHPRIYICSAR